MHSIILFVLIVYFIDTFVQSVPFNIFSSLFLHTTFLLFVWNVWNTNWLHISLPFFIYFFFFNDCLHINNNKLWEKNNPAIFCSSMRKLNVVLMFSLLSWESSNHSANSPSMAVYEEILYASHTHMVFYIITLSMDFTPFVRNSALNFSALKMDFDITFNREYAPLLLFRVFCILKCNRMHSIWKSAMNNQKSFRTMQRNQCCRNVPH